MSETSHVPDQPGDGDVPGWRVLTAVARGAVHEQAGRPLQDAAGFAAYPPGDPRWLAVAVADGHGGHPHFRSARGSELAIDAGLLLAGEAAAGFAGRQSAHDLRSAAKAELIPELIGHWRRAVEHDLLQHPWTDQEQQLLSGDDPTIAYGSTLLLAVVAVPWLVLCQIGDGDIVLVGADGTASLPVPGDPRLDGHSTTSLCQLDAADAFRVAVVDLAGGQAAALLLATDGFGNAQTADPWHQPVGSDLLRLAQEHGVAWVREQLPIWAARCASNEGSGDDTAMALLLRTEGPPEPPAARTQTRPARTLPIETPPEPTRVAQIPVAPTPPAAAEPEPTRPAKTLPWPRQAGPAGQGAPAVKQAREAPPAPGAPAL
ncbi:MAG TPA: protein phosphatase 2C domain-containing protein [Streptosporangiaceae bacterium]|nr:protein phosphatase 2C domain-containing protein [Streptosporangiaceae bacterium]